MKRIFASILSFCIVFPLLATPDIRICQFNSDSPDDFCIVCVDPIDPGTQIYFTDRNWNYSTKGFEQSNEGVLLWEAKSLVSSGTVVYISTNSSAHLGTVSVIEAGFNLANTSDVLWAYTIESDTIHPITAISLSSTFPDTTFTTSGLSASAIGAMTCDNGKYIGERELTPSLWTNLYANENWQVVRGTGSQYISPDTTPFRPFHPQIMPTADTLNLLARFPQGWISDTIKYVFNDTCLRTDKHHKYSTVLYPIYSADNIFLHLDTWGFSMTTQNNYGIILSGNKYFYESIGQASWNGYYIRISGSSGINNISLIRHNSNVNTETISFGAIDMSKAADGIDFSFTYFSDGTIGYEIQYSSDSVTSIASGRTDVIPTENQYFGIYTNLNTSTSSNISISRLEMRTSKNRYLLQSQEDFDKPESWQPARLFPLRSDRLYIDGFDSVVINKTMQVQSLSLINSKLFLVNDVTSEDVELDIFSSLSVDSLSLLQLTNSLSSTYSCSINIKEHAYAQIFGIIEYNGKGVIPNHKMTVCDNQPISFENGSRIIIQRQNGNPFKTYGSSYAAVFVRGSIFEQYDGESPFSNTDSIPLALFLEGSIYRYFGGGLSLTDGRYADLELSVDGQTNILMGGYGSGNIGRLRILKGRYTFGMQANILPVNIKVSESLYIAEGCQVDFSPTDSSAFSTFQITGGSVTGKGKLIVGANAKLILTNAMTDWKLNADILGNLQFGDSSIVSVDSSRIFVSGEIVNAGMNSYFAMPEDVNDTSSYLVRPVNGTSASILFPVGTLSGGFMPMTISRNSGDDANFSVRNFNGLYENGLYGSSILDADKLDNTWEITPDAQAIVDVDIAWPESSEREGFNRHKSQMIINHHRVGDEEWKLIERSQYSESDGLFHVKSLAISDFSTVSASGTSDPLAIYYRDFTASIKDGVIKAEWIQTIPADSACIYTSIDALHFSRAKTVSVERNGSVDFSIMQVSAPVIYLKMEQYKQGKLVETSEVLAVGQDRQNNKSLSLAVFGNILVVEKDYSETVNLKLYTSGGILAEESLLPAGEDLIYYQLQERCHQCIMYAESGSDHAVIILPNQD